MGLKILKILLISIMLISCSKKDKITSVPDQSKKSYETYNDAVKSMEEGDYFYAANKFKEAETLIPSIEDAAKSLIMSAYCHYIINFYDEMRSTLNLFLTKYPANEYSPYANYLIILSYYEQISDEKKAIEQYGSKDSGASLGDILGEALDKSSSSEGDEKDND